MLLLLRRREGCARHRAIMFSAVGVTAADSDARPQPFT
jgi:hypothetical protein